MKKCTALIVAFLITSVSGLPAKADAPAPVKRQAADGNSDSGDIVFSLYPPTIYTYKDADFQITSDRKDTSNTKVIGNRLHVSISAVGPAGQMSYEANSLNNTLSIDLEGQLNAKTQPNGYGDFMSIYGRQSTPSVLLTDKSPVVVTVKFTINVTHAASFNNKSSDPQAIQFGSTSNKTTTSLFLLFNRFEYNSKKGGSLTPKDEANEGLIIKVKAYPVTGGNGPTDGYQAIVGLDHPTAINGKIYRYGFDVMRLVNDYLRDHKEVQLIGNKLPGDLHKPPLEWRVDYWLAFQRNASTGDFALSSASEHIEVKVEQNNASKLDIIAPDSTINMTEDDGRTSLVPLKVRSSGQIGGNVTWDVALNYQSPKSQGNYVFNDSLELSQSQCVDNAYNYKITGKGGQLTIKAKAVVDGQIQVSTPVTIAIKGYRTAPTSQITERLLALGGPLMTGLAASESSYQGGLGQFGKDKMPRIATSAYGEAVGLKQVLISAHPTWNDWGSYWDWDTNAQRGVSDFKQKLQQVNQKIAKIQAQKGNEHLLSLSVGERENWALYRYKGFGLDDLYKPNDQHTKWIVNSSAHKYMDAKAQINSARSLSNQITQQGLTPQLP